MHGATTGTPRRRHHRAFAAWLIGMLVAAGTVLAPPGAVPAAAADPLHLIVADLDAPGGDGGLIDLDVTSRTTRQVASEGSFADPYGVTVDNDGYLLVADREAFPGGNGGIIRVHPSTGEQTPITSDRFMVNPTGVVVEEDGGILVADADARGPDGTAGVGGVIRVDPDTGVQTLVSWGGRFGNPTGIALDVDGNIFVADTAAFGGDGGVIRVDPDSGDQVEVASNGAFGDPTDLVVEPDGDILVIDRDWDSGDGGVVRVPAGSVALRPTVSQHEVTRSDNWGNPAGIERAADGRIFVADPDRDGIFTVDPSSGQVAVLSNPSGLYGAPVGLVVAPASPPAPTPVLTGPHAPVTFTQPASSSPLCTSYQYVVPPGVTELAFEVVGEPGNTGGDPVAAIGDPGSGGFAAVVRGVLSVTPGLTLYGNVAHNRTGGTGHQGQEGHGGDMSFLSADPSSGQPATEGGCNTDSFVVVAGGGGGGGTPEATFGGTGGNAGYPNGENGRSGGSGTTYENAPGRGGGGGTQTAGGAAGPSTGVAGNGRSGSFQLGGDLGCCAGISGGGGGGGLYGGGSGGKGDFAGGGGGGGGSSYFRTGSVRDGVGFLAPTRLTPPSITLRPLGVQPTVTLAVDPRATVFGQPTTFTATVDPAPSTSPTAGDPGTVTFRDTEDDSILGTVAVDPSTGVAILRLVLPSERVFNAIAVYSGNGGYLAGAESNQVLGIVAAPNQSPVAVNDVAQTLVNTPVTIDVVANDSDADGDPLTTSFVDPPICCPLNGSVTANPDGTFTYTPDLDFTGVGTFRYLLSDGKFNTINQLATVTVTVAAEADTDGDGFTPIAGGDCDDADPAVNPAAEEVDNDIDDNCDGAVDEGLDVDADGDGHTLNAGGDCNDADPAVNPGAVEIDNGVDDNCNGTADEGFDADGDGYTPNAGGDCNDADRAVNPGADEGDNGVDDNCDGTVDEGFDTDGDGYTPNADGDCNDGEPAINPGADEVDNDIDDNCNGSTDEGFDADGDGYTPIAGGDCDDSDLAINPGAGEVDNGVDDNCDGTVDDGFDADGDGYTAIAGRDCNDADAAVNPAAVEVDNGIDDNCDGIVDEGFDADGDGYTPIGGGDCDDRAAAINPAAVELDNGIDDNCNGSTDEGFDGDGDGYTPIAGADCNDADPSANPGAGEVDNGIDDNCDGIVDEGFDADGDGFTPIAGRDADDSDSTVYPGAAELCDGKDNDQDATVDDGFDDTDADGRADCVDDDDDGDGLTDQGDPDVVGDVVAAAPASSFGSRGHRDAFLSRLVEIEQIIVDDDTRRAVSELRELRKKVDGCNGTTRERPTTTTGSSIAQRSENCAASSMPSWHTSRPPHHADPWRHSRGPGRRWSAIRASSGQTVNAAERLDGSAIEADSACQSLGRPLLTTAAPVERRHRRRTNEAGTTRRPLPPAVQRD